MKKAVEVSIQDVAKQSAAPWETNGRKWHLETSVDRKGKPIRWERKILAAIIDRIEQFGSFASVNWASPSIVEVTGPVKTQGWFMHAITAETWLLKIKIRIPKGRIKKIDFEETIDLPTLNEMDEVEAYGNESRIRVSSGNDWQEIELRLFRFDEINKPKFWKLFEKCMQAFTEHVLPESVARPEDQTEKKRLASKLESETSNPVDLKWHTSEKGFDSSAPRQWPSTLVPAFQHHLESLIPKMTWDWTSPEQVIARVGQNALSIRTKIASHLEVAFESVDATLIKSSIKELGKRCSLIVSPSGNSGVTVKISSADQLTDRAYVKLVLALLKSNSAPATKTKRENSDLPQRTKTRRKAASK